MAEKLPTRSASTSCRRPHLHGDWHRGRPGIVESMDDAEITAALERAHVARAAYAELLSRARTPQPGDLGSDDLARLRELKSELYAAEAALARLKRARETTHPSHLL